MNSRIFLILVILTSCHQAPFKNDDDRADQSIRRVLGSDNIEGFARAIEPRIFQFPQDHLAHRSFRNEWWYVTGNLFTHLSDSSDIKSIDSKGEVGERFGFQLTFFRSALTPNPQDRTSRWATNTIWMAHFGLTDRQRNQHRGFERFSRESLGLAGVRGDPARIWVENWSLTRKDRQKAPREPSVVEEVRADRQTAHLRDNSLASDAQPRSDDHAGWHIEVQQDDLILSLDLDPQKPIVLQGQKGLSQKSAAKGNASYYYSYTRMRAKGKLVSSGETRTVSGSAWFDREWSTSALSEEQLGWDWFAIQLDDGRDLMLYRMRRKDGKESDFSSGSLVDREGRNVHLGSNDFRIVVTKDFRAASGTVYPHTFAISVGPAGLRLNVRPIVDDQEMRLTFPYWEGAIDVLDDSGNRLGYGYVEMTGY